MNMPLNYKLGSKALLLSNRSDSDASILLDSTPTPPHSLNTHALKSSLHATTISTTLFSLPLQGVNAHLIPSLSLSLNIFNNWVQGDISLALANLLSLDAIPGPSPSCPAKIELSRTHSVEVNADLSRVGVTYTKKVWSSGKMRMGCLFGCCGGGGEGGVGNDTVIVGNQTLHP